MGNILMSHFIELTLFMLSSLSGRPLKVLAHLHSGFRGILCKGNLSNLLCREYSWCLFFTLMYMYLLALSPLESYSNEQQSAAMMDL